MYYLNTYITMTLQNTDRTRIPIVQLVWPLLVENILRASLMSVDTFMLSAFSKEAVAAMSLVNSVMFFIQLLYMMIAIGTNILISQYLGARKRSQAGLVGIGSMVLVGGFAAVLSIIYLVLAHPFVSLFKLEPIVARYAGDFLAIYGGLSIFMAINIIQANILRAWGYPADSMVVNAIALGVTVTGNALFLFGPFGIPVLGVTGVAISTVFSQFVACFILAWRIRQRKEILLPFKMAFSVPKRIYSKILSIGVPSAGENISYNMSQMMILSLVARIGTDALATFGIMLAILRYVFMPGLSIGMGAQIKVGYLVGAGRHDEAAGRVYRYFSAGFAISLLLVLCLNLVKTPVLALFTENPLIVSLATTTFLVSILLEPGRNFNMIFTPALKSAGDVRFPVLIGIISMWGIGVLGAYFFAFVLNIGFTGIYIAMAMDEWIRGIVILIRWKSGAWRKKRLIEPSPVTPGMEAL
jgi:putative MATE family efflux protein